VAFTNHLSNLCLVQQFLRNYLLVTKCSNNLNDVKVRFDSLFTLFVELLHERSSLFVSHPAAPKSEVLTEVESEGVQGKDLNLAVGLADVGAFVF